MTQPNVAQIRERIADIHGRNVAAGWWTDPKTGESLKGKRPALELLALVHSEVSEGLEGLRKNLMDTHLAERPMVEVELADAEIRVYDMMGGFDLDVGFEQDDLEDFLTDLAAVDRMSEALGLLHILVSSASVGFLLPKNCVHSGPKERANDLTLIILGLHAVAHKFGYDVDGAREAKLIFNETREDHRLENRIKTGGKLI